MRNERRVASYSDRKKKTKETKDNGNGKVKGSERKTDHVSALCRGQGHPDGENEAEAEVEVAACVGDDLKTELNCVRTERKTPVSQHCN